MTIVVETTRSQAAAEHELRRHIEAQRLVDHAYSLAGIVCDPPAEELFRIEREGTAWTVVLDDPSLAACRHATSTPMNGAA